MPTDRGNWDWPDVEDEEPGSMAGAAAVGAAMGILALLLIFGPSWYWIAAGFGAGMLLTCGVWLAEDRAPKR